MQALPTLGVWRLLSDKQMVRNVTTSDDAYCKDGQANCDIRHGDNGKQAEHALLHGTGRIISKHG